jgi:hypothetical protein
MIPWNRKLALPRSRWAAPALLLGAAVCAVGGITSVMGACSARALPQVAPLDCAAAEAPYDFKLLETYEPGWGVCDQAAVDMVCYGWYGYGDLTPGAYWTGEPTAPPVEPIENGGRCGSMNALFLQSRGFQDYGSGFGTYSIGGYATTSVPGLTQTPCPDPLVAGGFSACAIDATGYDGLTFWARSLDPTGAPTTKGFTLTINDKSSSHGVTSVDAGTGDGSPSCIPYDASPNGSANTYLPTIGTGPAGGGITSAVPPANACGNGFTYPLLTTDQWQLYTIPWSAFGQLARPNREPDGFDPSSFMQVTIVVPKEAMSALWIDNLGLYRAKRGGGLEAGD